MLEAFKSFFTLTPKIIIHTLDVVAGPMLVHTHTHTHAHTHTHP